MDTSSLIHSSVPVIATGNIGQSVNYYVNVLGFSPDFVFGDPPVYAGVKSGEAEIYFTYDPHLAETLSKNALRPEIFIWIKDADRLFKAQSAKGAEVIETVSDRPWGARQYVLRDIHGYHLKFAQPI